MRDKVIKYLILLPVLLAASCSDDIDLPVYDYGLVGSDVTVNIPVSLPSMEVKSRDALNETQLNQVNSLWVRAYSSLTGSATSDWHKLAPATADSEVPHSLTLTTKSGPTFIVAVANVENTGVTRRNVDNPRPLAELLDEADTWTQFLDIAVSTPSDYMDVNSAPVPLAMSGFYTSVPVGNAATHPNLQSWAALGFKPVTIPASSTGTVTLPGNGAIHLRRVVSHVTFNVKAGDQVRITPQSYTVVNVPRYSWIYEHDTAEAGQLANPGDYSTSQADAEKYYTTPQQFTSQFFSNVQPDGSCSFDFWQGENKHNALPDAGCDSYNKRELETKVENPNTAENHPLANTGLYTSLTGNTWTPNNMASFVVMRCLVDYRNQLDVDSNGTETPDGEPVHRTGNAEFVVHLGYLNNNAADFNCYRNVEYTYNLTVNGVDDIRLEAFGSEQVPGAEGIVSDVENAILNLDCHYSAFNIELTRAELTNVNPETGQAFGYIINVYDGNAAYTFTNENPPSEDQQIYIDWVQLRPTTGRNVLADFRPRTGSGSDGRTFNLQDASNARNWDSGDSRFSESGWYTVFVDEYTYEDNSDETTDGTRPNWQRYVNKDDRQFYVRVTRSISEDGQSFYTRSKYAASQASIQSYYSDRNFTPASGAIGAGTAIGVERTNETEGLNLRSSLTYDDNYYSGNQAVINGTNSDPDNGRYNVWLWLTNGSGGTSGGRWTDFVATSTPMSIGAVTSANAQYGAELPARTESIPKLVNFRNATTARQLNTALNYTPAGVASGANNRSSNDPQPNSDNPDYYIEAINACMSRNRDNNGNGVIDPEELRWYVPAIGKYLRMIIGESSIYPLISFNRVSQIPQSASQGNGAASRYLYFSSNGRVLWTMEGSSTSKFGQYCQPPWQIRCIRNLGSDLSTVTRGEKVVPAYVANTDTRTVRMAYYDVNNLRNNAFTGNGTGADRMPVHMVSNESYNLLYKAFEYNSSLESHDVTTTSVNAWHNAVVNHINSNPCSKYDTATKSGWRLPNAKELAIMRNVGAFNNDWFAASGGNAFIFSCTVSYFDKGIGGTYPTTTNPFLATRSDGLTQVGDAVTPIRYRCVRDVE